MTKIPRLPETDLARFMAISDQTTLEQAIDQFDAGHGIWSYDPVRASTPDLLGASTPLFGKSPRAPWEKIERQIRSACYMAAQAEANALVGKVLYDESLKKGWSATNYMIGSLSAGYGEAVRFWDDVVISEEGRPLVAFFDHRRSSGTTNAATRRIIFSMQHVGVRDRYPDLAKVRLAVIRFPANGGTRSMSVEYCDEIGLLSYEELNSRMTNVYRTWANAAERRKRAAGSVTLGPLFGGA